MMTTRRDGFQAIADPTRRRILHILIEKPLNLNGIAQHFEISRPAVSKQVKILEACGLVEVRQEGRDRICHCNLRPLGEVYDWIGTYRKFWMAKIDRLEAFLEEERSGNPPEPQIKNHKK